MPYNVFVSYATKDLKVVDHVRKMVGSQKVRFFVAEYSVAPGTPLNQRIISAIERCDLFLLILSQNSLNSVYVQQEIGIAKGNKKITLPVALQPTPSLPAFIQDLKYLPAYKNPVVYFDKLKGIISKQAEKKEQSGAIALSILGALGLWAMSSNK